MKNIIYRIAVFCLMATAMTGNISGQVISRVVEYPSLNGTAVKMQLHGSAPNSLIHYEQYTHSQHFFAYRTGGIAYKYTMPIFNNVYGGANYTVEDMRVVGNECFFCGKMSYITGMIYLMDSGWTYTYTNMGYVAKMSLGSAGDPVSPHMDVHISTLDETCDITRMTINTYNTDTLVGLIGKFCNNDKIPCIIAMKGGGAAWYRTTYRFADTTEMLTDVTFGEKYLITTSRFGGERYTFGLRYALIDDLFYYDDITGYEKLNKFNTVNMHENNAAQKDFTWHKNNEMIRLVSVPGTYNVIVAHKGYHWLQGDNFSNNVAMYYIDGSDPDNIVMTRAQSSPTATDTGSILMDMKYLYTDLYTNIGLVFRTYTGQPAAGVLRPIQWETGGFKDYQAYYQYMTSIDNRNEKIWTAGMRRDNSMLFQYYQDNIISTGCLGPEYGDNVDLVPLPERSLTTVTLYKETSDKELAFTHHRMAGTINYFDVPCNLLK